MDENVFEPARQSSIDQCRLSRGTDPSQTTCVEFIREGWLSWQMAMAGGWVEEWVDAMCEDNVKLADHFADPENPIVGKDQICSYYNRLLNKAWGVGCKMSWCPNNFTPGEENGSVVADYDVTLTHPTGKKITTRHVDTFQLSRDNKIRNIEFKPLPRIRTEIPREATNDFVVGTFATPKPAPDFRKAHTAASRGLPDDARSFIYHGWKTWTRAMANGWIGEWINAFCTKDVIFRDHHKASQGVIKNLSGIPEVVDYYNKMLQVVWGIGSTVQWKAISFTETSPTVVMAEFHITVRNTKGIVTHSRQEYQYRMDGRRINEVIIMPATLSTEPPVSPVLKKEPDPPQQEQQQPQDRVVLLVRPCTHNSWDNVRIKRGWLVLRCRLCHGQWRQRPVEIKRCPEFAENSCEKGANCEFLHIHHIKHTKVQRDQAKGEFDMALEFVRTPEGIAVVSALLLVSCVSAVSAKTRRRTNTCPPVSV